MTDVINIWLHYVYVQEKTVLDRNAAVIYRQSDFTKGQRTDAMCYHPRIRASDADPEFITSRTRPSRPISKDAICNLAIVIDHTFFREIAQSNVGMAVTIVTQHVAQADYIFRMTDMDFDGLPNNIGFEIHNIKIFETLAAADYRLKDMSLTKEELIRRISMYDFSDYCLAIGFLYRDFGQRVFPACIISVIV